MSKIWKYLIFALFAIMVFFWIRVVVNAGKTNGADITENIEAYKEKSGKIVGDLMNEQEENDEADNDVGNGEDDLDADELDEDEILTEDWEEDDIDEEEEEVTAVEEYEDEEDVQKYKEAMTPKQSVINPANIVTTSRNGKFLVIGGSFSSKGNANTFVNQLEKLGYEDAEIVVFDRAKKYHTVAVARFDSKNDASQLVGALRGKGIKDAYVHKKRG